jgi:hypothetical protein
MDSNVLEDHTAVSNICRISTQKMDAVSSEKTGNILTVKMEAVFFCNIGTHLQYYMLL